MGIPIKPPPTARAAAAVASASARAARSAASVGSGARARDVERLCQKQNIHDTFNMVDGERI